MTLDEKDTVLRIWAASLPDNGPPGDWLCLLVRTGAGNLKGEYRYRYHRGSNIDADDKFSRHGFTSDNATPEAIAVFVNAVRDLTKHGRFTNVIEREVNGGAHAFAAAMLDLPGWQVLTRLEPKP